VVGAKAAGSAAGERGQEAQHEEREGLVLREEDVATGSGNWQWLLTS
jgi:hypothetical protein